MIVRSLLLLFLVSLLDSSNAVFFQKERYDDYNFWADTNGYLPFEVALNETLFFANVVRVSGKIYLNTPNREEPKVSIDFKDKDKKRLMSLEILTSPSIARLTSHEGNKAEVQHDFRPGQTLIVHFRFHDDLVEIFVNFKDFAEFAIHPSTEAIQSISVDGDFVLQKVDLGRQNVLMDQWEHDYGSLKEGRVVVTGQVNGDFEIAFRSSQKDMPLYVNPRFGDKEVVRNAYIGYNGKWQNEERWGGFPFVRGDLAEMTFFVSNDGVECYVNGEYAFEFKHRVTDFLKNYRTLYIRHLRPWNVLWS
ncbi:hypothetical protein QR680_016872 [Steinernema hermaphroditum]|uniref:Galectin n=1 Tax=Steinernema hermaphroditum TaxID=289476 RepID=A0AA39LMN0_9BILA|nr:hypothetical protein QR680_016872 [Steinernema hermaphroditum]